MGGVALAWIFASLARGLPERPLFSGFPFWAQNRHIEDEAHARSQWRSWCPSYSVLAPIRGRAAVATAEGVARKAFCSHDMGK